MAKKKKPILLSAVMANDNHDSVKMRFATQMTNGQRFRVDHELIRRAEQAWNNKEDVRKTAERTINYTFDDDQWGDYIEVDGDRITEREYIKRTGQVPLSDNIMVSIYSTITGLYDKQGSEPNAVARDNVNLWLSDMMSATLQCNWQNNKVPRTLSVAWRNFILTGIAAVRSSYDMQDDGIKDVDTRLIEPFKLLWEGGTDPNFRDINLIGRLCDEPRERLYQLFAKPEYGLTIEDINEIYGITDDGEAMSHVNSLSHYYEDANAPEEQQNEQNSLDNISFHSANTPHCYRVVEVWTRESKSRIQCWDPIGKSQEEAYFKIENSVAEIARIKTINDARIKQFTEAGIALEECPLIKMEPITDVFWYFTFMAPDGSVLCSGESPYDHKKHPFTLVFFPYVNGKIYPYMSFVIPQQRNLNRLNIMNDMAIRSATKGLTVYAEDTIPDDMTTDEFERQLTSYRGVARYKISNRNENSRPDIITSNAANLGIPELMQMKINLMQQVANVSGALQGKTPSAGTAASRYRMESENSTTSLFTLINDFSGFMEDLALKICELVKQYYEQDRLIFSKKGNANMIYYDAISARDMKFLVSVKEAAATAAYQQRQQEKLNILFDKGMLDVFTYLDNSGDPMDQQLAQQIRTSQQQGQFAQQNFQVPGANQQAVARAEQIMGLGQQNEYEA